MSMIKQIDQGTVSNQSRVPKGIWTVLESYRKLSEHEKQAMLSTDPCGKSCAVAMESYILVIE